MDKQLDLNKSFEEAQQNLEKQKLAVVKSKTVLDYLPDSMKSNRELPDMLLNRSRLLDFVLPKETGILATMRKVYTLSNRFHYINLQNFWVFNTKLFGTFLMRFCASESTGSLGDYERSKTLAAGLTVVDVQLKEVK